MAHRTEFSDGISEDKICVLDFGGQYCHLIARRIRELGVYAEIHPGDASLNDLKGCRGIILSGGPRSVYSREAPPFNKDIFSLNVPVLGICYGHQLIAYTLNGKVNPGETKEYGFSKVKVIAKSPLFEELENEENVWMSHGDSVAEMPPGFTLIGTTSDCSIAAMADLKHNFYGVQFHPEVTHTEKGMRIFDNFLRICSVERTWTMKGFSEKIKTEILAKVKDKKVFLLVSGGVDSVVGFALLNNALGIERVYGLHIDTGMMRKNEAKEVKSALERLGFSNFHVLDASSDFLSALTGVSDPEEKRRIIGSKFLEVQKRELKEIGFNEDDWLLGQGTIYPDTIESSGTKHADLIKTHHNRIPIITKMLEEGRVIEPLSYLYKDEVRELGKELGLPPAIIERHPFPGPGLGIRVLCSKENIPAESQKLADICRNFGIESQILPIRSVGVQGDERSYRHCALIWDPKIKGLPDEKTLTEISTRITNSCREVNRVIYLLHPKAPERISAKEAYLTEERLSLLRDIDDFVTQVIKRSAEYNRIWQFPVVLLPVGWKHHEAIVLRPIISKEAMTASFAMLSETTISQLTDYIGKKQVDFIAYDITNKPPATIEWE